MNSAVRMTSVSLLALVAAACSTPTPVGIKPTDVPPAFTAPVPRGVQLWPTPAWWNTFTSPELAGLESDAQQNNLDLAVAAAQVLQAQAQTGIAASPLFPDIGLNASATRNGADKGIGVGPGGAVKRAGNTFAFGGSASYVLDLWGEARDNLHAAQYTMRSSQFAQETVALTIQTSVADTYLNVLGLRQRIAIIEANIDAAKRILVITQAKVTNGVSSNLDLAQQQAQLAQQEAQLPGLQEQEREQRYALAILLGRVPEGFDVKGKSLDGITPPLVAPGLPSELLERRPDVAGAEADLASQHASVDAARAAFFPQIGLSASGGWSSTALSSLIAPESVVWSIGASLVQTIFNGGLHAAQSDLQIARETQLVATYRKTVLTAFSDTESSLGQVAALADQQRLEEEEVRAAAEAFRISELQYREGVTDLLAVLQSQQTLFTAEDQLVQTKQARLEAVVGLYQSLGGGWTVEATPELPDANPLRPF
jgi:NodT family efflux transporter outer membrane factor (OMF) lipoprotein